MVVVVGGVNGFLGAALLMGGYGDAALAAGAEVEEGFLGAALLMSG